MVDVNLRGLLTYLFFIWVGYICFLYFSHPQKKKNKMPNIRFGIIEILPNFRIHLGKKTYHIHHWVTLSIITALVLLNYESFKYITVLKGMAVGGIIQGLAYPDRFKFRHPKKLTSTAKN